MLSPSYDRDGYPAFGQGMSVAAQEAVSLKRLLDDNAGEKTMPQLAGRFFNTVSVILETPWNVALCDFAYPQTRGVRPAGLAEMLQFGAALDLLAAQDPYVHKIQSEVWDLVRPHSDLFMPEIVGRLELKPQATSESRMAPSGDVTIVDSSARVFAGPGS